MPLQSLITIARVGVTIIGESDWVIGLVGAFCIDVPLQIRSCERHRFLVLEFQEIAFSRKGL